jgi:hypothetical protein
MRVCRRRIWECDEAQRDAFGWHIRATFSLGVLPPPNSGGTSNGHARPEGNHLARAGLVSRPVGREEQEVYHEHGAARQFGIGKERGR